MKANVQYNDFIGTSAADISDHRSLDDFLASRGININRFESIGATFYTGYSDFFSASILCIDKKQSTKEKAHIVKIHFESELSKEEFFDLFKRFNVIIMNKFSGFQNDEIDEEITFDELENAKE